MWSRRGSRECGVQGAAESVEYKGQPRVWSERVGECGVQGAAESVEYKGQLRVWSEGAAESVE